MKIGFILEGGAMRGLYSAGIIDTLIDQKIFADVIIGVSAGALFGMNYKSRQKGRVLRYNTRFAHNKNYMGLYSLLTTGNIVNKNFCFNQIVHYLDPVDFKTYRQTPEQFYAVVTNIETGQAEYPLLDDLEKRENMEYLRASGAMPFVSQPVKINNHRYLDGGCSDSIPIDKMLEMNVDKIVVILTRPCHYQKKASPFWPAQIFYHKYPAFVQTLNHRYLNYNQSLEKVAELEKKQQIFVFRPSKHIKIKRLEKNISVLQAMYRLGCHDANSQMKQLLQYLNDTPSNHYTPKKQ